MLKVYSPLSSWDGDVDGKNWVFLLTVWGVIMEALFSVSIWLLFCLNPKSLVVSLMNRWKRLSWDVLDLGWKLSTLTLFWLLSSCARAGDRDIVGRLFPFLRGALFPASSFLPNRSFLLYLLLIFSLMIAFFGFGGTTGLLSHILDLTVLTILSSDNRVHLFPQSNWLSIFKGGDWSDFDCLILPLWFVDATSSRQFTLNPSTFWLHGLKIRFCYEYSWMK